jgi:hypothetical protein
MMQRLSERSKISHLIAVSGVLSVLVVLPALARISVDVNGSPMDFTGVQPASIGGRVFIPLRAVAESLGAEVRWNAASQTVFGNREGRDFELPLGSRRATVQGRAVTLDAPARMMHGTTMVPLRFVAEALGAEVNWDPSSQRVAVNLEGAKVTSKVAGSRMVIPGNTVVRVKLDNELSSKTARRGDEVSATIDRDDRSRFPEGTKFEGEVTQVQKSKDGEPGVIDLAFSRAVLPDGTSVQINGELASLDEKDVQQTPDGRLEAKAGKKKKFDLKWVGIGAAGGAVLSTILGGKALKGALIGALGGAAYAYLNQKKGAKVGDVELAEGTEFGIRLDNRVAFADNTSYRYPR